MLTKTKVVLFKQNKFLNANLTLKEKIKILNFLDKFRITNLNKEYQTQVFRAMVNKKYYRRNQIMNSNIKDLFWETPHRFYIINQGENSGQLAWDYYEDLGYEILAYMLRLVEG